MESLRRVSSCSPSAPVARSLPHALVVSTSLQYCSEELALRPRPCAKYSGNLFQARNVQHICMFTRLKEQANTVEGYRLRLDFQVKLLDNLSRQIFKSSQVKPFKLLETFPLPFFLFFGNLFKSVQVLPRIFISKLPI